MGQFSVLERLEEATTTVHGGVAIEAQCCSFSLLWVSMRIRGYGSWKPQDQILDRKSGLLLQDGLREHAATCFATSCVEQLDSLGTQIKTDLRVKMAIGGFSAFGNFGIPKMYRKLNDWRRHTMDYLAKLCNGTGYGGFAIQRQPGIPLRSLFFNATNPNSSLFSQKLIKMKFQIWIFSALK
ncbi:hypothetical protein PIB30_090881 [Stylosanthes scabra]|uniref:Uncharacterized protein n=1 Tax=Stylosanthes scabra TaxID=79078 RepID=A0ABU6XU81_9FABA|nr:hypothetical protein [Stylosanthes scabra]